MPASAKARAIRLLAQREHSRAELERKLTAGGTPLAEARAALDEVAALGLLSDARCAESIVRQRAGTHAKRAVARELARKGIAREEIDRALGEGTLDDERALRVAWERRYGAPPIDERDKARQVRFLEARGFALSAILKLLRDIASGDRPKS